MRDFNNFVDGEFVPSFGTGRIVVKNPSTGEVICSVPDSTQQDIDAALAAAVKAQHPWAKQPAAARAKLLKSIILRRGLEGAARSEV